MFKAKNSKPRKRAEVDVTFNVSDNVLTLALIGGITYLGKEVLSLAGGGAIALYDNAMQRCEERRAAKKKAANRKDVEE